MEPVLDNADVVLHDSFAQPESDYEEISVLIDSPRARRVVMYTWEFHPHLVRSARQLGYPHNQAVLWGVKNGFMPDHHRIDHWRGGP